MKLHPGPAEPGVSPPCVQAGDMQAAAICFLHDMECAPAGRLRWAEQAVTAYALLAQNELAGIPRPGWWNDDTLKSLSVAVLEARPDYSLAWRMRGEVLSACLGACNWTAAPRSASELQEAGRCLQRAAVLGDGRELADREAIVRQAVACFRAAQHAHHAPAR